MGIVNIDEQSFYGAMHIMRNKTKIFTNREQFYFKIINWSLGLKITSLIRENRAYIKVSRTNMFFNDLPQVLRSEKLVESIKMLREYLQKYLSFQYCELLLFDNISTLSNRKHIAHYRRYHISAPIRAQIPYIRGSNWKGV